MEYNPNFATKTRNKFSPASLRSQGINAAASSPSLKTPFNVALARSWPARILNNEAEAMNKWWAVDRLTRRHGELLERIKTSHFLPAQHYLRIINTHAVCHNACVLDVIKLANIYPGGRAPQRQTGVRAAGRQGPAWIMYVCMTLSEPCYFTDRGDGGSVGMCALGGVGGWVGGDQGKTAWINVDYLQGHWV